MPSADDASSARDTLANRRTFLAYTRTALALIGGGVALGLLKSGDGTLVQRLAAVVLVVAGAGITIGGLIEWRLADAALRAGRPLRRSGLIPATTAIVVLVAVLLLGTAAFG
ncbi:DUF202 domain-containing protein [Leifsonia shinshuensis]|uniref:DUF202 domain-containing protein n=1 Tax=Leifsonia shinshuensis TaxID=150026 RepID=UPI00285C33E3|nr:DUF202 domain-containing protein [Leifsonia shinshuensis]MDR6972775.1 putative membrane protein [Leifsonia shinshuensis]